MVYYVLLLLAILTNSVGGLLMKLGSEKVPFGNGESTMKVLSSMATNWQLIIGITSYGLSFVFSTLVYTKISLNIAYPVMVGSSFLLISLASLVFLGERFNTIQILGSVFLVSGIGMIASNIRA